MRYFIDFELGGVSKSGKISGRVIQGVVTTTFHFPEFKTNILTSEYADWSTETPEYKVTAVSLNKAERPFASREFKPLLKGNDEIKSMFLDICRIFSPYPLDVAAEEVQNHIDKYWEPVLRMKLFEIYGSNESNFKTVIKEVIGNLTNN